MSVRDILDALDRAPTVAGTLSAAKALELAADETLPVVKVAILRNYTVETFLPYLTVQLYRGGLRPRYHVGEFDAAEQEALTDGGALYAFEPDFVVVALRIQSLVPRVIYRFAELSSGEIDVLSEEVRDRIQRICEALRARCSATLLVHNFELPEYPATGFVGSQSVYGQHNVIKRLNLDFAQSVPPIGSAYIIDIEHVMARVGYRHSLDHRYWHIGRAPYTQAFHQVLAAEYVKPIMALRGKAKKCLVLDCDNTLWGGVVGEDGLNGIKLGTTHPGSGYADFQLAVLDLYHRGVLLAICSKNNDADVLDVLTNHPGCHLKPEHFVARRVNWQDKPTNLREIAAELNIGIDSLVFIDDSEFECNMVRAELPEVTTIRLSGDSTSYRSVLQAVGLFDTVTLSDEDKKRSQMYRAEALRKATLSSAISLDAYLASLGMVLTISDATDYAIPRIAQLTNKTNQFNLTTRRYSEDDIRGFVSSPDMRVYFAELTDKYDSSGIIAVATVKYVGELAVIDTLLMSCRVIGRGVEQALLAHIADEARNAGRQKIVGEYIPTAKNAQVEGFYGLHGFVRDEACDGAFWEYDLARGGIEAPGWFARIDKKSGETHDDR